MYESTITRTLNLHEIAGNEIAAIVWTVQAIGTKAGSVQTQVSAAETGVPTCGSVQAQESAE